MELLDRVALITGASGGLGAVTARMLPDHGVHVAVTHLGVSARLRASGLVE